MIVSRKEEMETVRQEKSELFTKDVLHILNGQCMYEEWKANNLLSDSNYAPFNEAMCVNATTEHVFGPKFITTRASGHRDSVEGYKEKVIKPLARLFNKEYSCLVLWFGEDMFCQMNLLTILSYLEQSSYKGTVYVHSFKEEEFKVKQTEVKLGHYESVYKEVLVSHEKPSYVLLPVMNRAIDIYLDMLKEDNVIVTYIKRNKELSTTALVNKLMTLFPSVGYGDSQYIDLINKTR